MTTSTLPRLAESAVAARGGADLYRFTLRGQIPDAAFAKDKDGTYLVKGVDLLKTGVFNGLSLIDEDLRAMVLRFESLRDRGIFVPPFRLDHSWSVLSVIGYFEALTTYRRVDETDGQERTFLAGDVRLTGSVDYTPDVLVDAIKRGALRNRSSELGYYVTNSGEELPLVFYGNAIVDIPAVEGLGPVTLSQTRPEPHRITNLSLTEGSPTMTPEQIARLTELRASTNLSADDEVERDELEALEAAQEQGTETPGPDVAAASSGSEDAAGTTGEGEEPPADEQTGEEEETPSTGGGGEQTPAEETAAERAPETGEQHPEVSDELRQAREEIARLRREGADREVARFRQAGVLSQANEGAALTLLTHDDEGVRRAAGTLLGGIPAPVTLGRRSGRTDLSTDGNGSGSAGDLIRLGMSKDEVGPLWASLTPAERKLRQSEYDAWAADRRENGVTD